MLLDLDQGRMTVWKNDEKLGVMRAEGLSGPLYWAVSIGGVTESARIESAAAPTSPTEEELVSAKAWQETAVIPTTVEIHTSTWRLTFSATSSQTLTWLPTPFSASTHSGPSSIQPCRPRQPASAAPLFIIKSTFN